MQLINVMSVVTVNSLTVPSFGCPGQAEVANKELSSRTTHNLDVVVVA